MEIPVMETNPNGSLSLETKPAAKNLTKKWKEKKLVSKHNISIFINKGKNLHNIKLIIILQFVYCCSSNCILILKTAFLKSRFTEFPKPHARWSDPKQAPKAAKEIAKARGEAYAYGNWRHHLVITWTCKYVGKSFKFIAENDPGWMINLMSKYLKNGQFEQDNDSVYVKKELLIYCNAIPALSEAIKNRSQVR